MKKIIVDYITVLSAITILIGMLAGCSIETPDIEADITQNTTQKELITSQKNDTATDITTYNIIDDTSMIETELTTVPETDIKTVIQTQAPIVTSIPETPISGNSTSSNGKTIIIKDGITYVDGILIVNKTYSLPDSYDPGGLTSECYSAFSEMKSAAKADGVSLWVKSGLRRYIDQKIIYNDYAASDGVAVADTYSARPGHSEHQSGLAIDVNSTSYSFADTAEGVWLAANCYKYGFIIRYPNGKEAVTGYNYEPWHIRYVGVDIATAVQNSGLCLEEYLGITSSYIVN